MVVRNDGSSGSLGKLADALGDSTRRSILKYVLDAGKPVSASEVGDLFGVHRTVARERLEVMLPPRRYESLARLLLHVVKSLLPTAMAVQHAHAAGYEYGVSVRREMQGSEDGRMAPEAACAWLAQEGYAARCERDPGADVFIFDNCVYREIAFEHVEIACAFSRGMLCGLIGVAPDDLTQTNNMVDHGFCRHEIKR